jgi:hypothetical protein
MGHSHSFVKEPGTKQQRKQYSENKRVVTGKGRELTLKLRIGTSSLDSGLPEKVGQKIRKDKSESQEPGISRAAGELSGSAPSPGGVCLSCGAEFVLSRLILREPYRSK